MADQSRTKELLEKLEHLENIVKEMKAKAKILRASKIKEISRTEIAKAYFSLSSLNNCLGDYENGIIRLLSAIRDEFEIKEEEEPKPLHSHPLFKV